LKAVVLLEMFVETQTSFIRILWEGSKEQLLFKIEIFSNNGKVFTVTYDKFNASLLYKSINFFSKIVLTPNFFLTEVYIFATW